MQQSVVAGVRIYDLPGVNVIALKTLRVFWEKHPDAVEPLQAWHDGVRAEDWGSAADAVRQFPNVSVLNDRRLVFNIGGNKYRLVVKVHFKTKTVFVRFIGTHADYDRIDANKV